MPRLKTALSAGEYAVLGVLREQPLHGYEVARRFTEDQELGLVLPMDMSSVYSLLKSLDEHGLIDGRRETVGLRPPRTVYALTPGSEALVREWLAEPVERMREVRSTFLVKLYFCRAISLACTAQLLDEQLAVSRAYLVRLVDLAAAAPPRSFERLVRLSKVTAADATLAWLAQERLETSG